MVVRDHSECQDKDCFLCKVRSVSVNPYAMPTRKTGNKASSAPNNSWAKGVPTDSRGMPMLNEKGDAMTVREHERRGHEIEQRKRQLANKT